MQRELAAYSGARLGVKVRESDSQCNNAYQATSYQFVVGPWTQVLAHAADNNSKQVKLSLSLERWPLQLARQGDYR